MPLVKMKHVFQNEFSKHFSILKSPTELLYIKHSAGDFLCINGDGGTCPHFGPRGDGGDRHLRPLRPLRLPYPFNRQQARLFCLKNIQSGVVIATRNIFTNYFARCCITGDQAKVHQLITVARRSNNDI